MPFSPCVLMLQTAEHLIRAHKTAKQYDDDAMVALIEAAMFHVGGTLSDEYRRSGGVLPFPSKGPGGSTERGA